MKRSKKTLFFENKHWCPQSLTYIPYHEFPGFDKLFQLENSQTSSEIRPRLVTSVLVLFTTQSLIRLKVCSWGKSSGKAMIHTKMVSHHRRSCERQQAVPDRFPHWCSQDWLTQYAGFTWRLAVGCGVKTHSKTRPTLSGPLSCSARSWLSVDSHPWTGTEKEGWIHNINA